jgi:poly(beta-D-mannuronate) C5 epimerase
MKTYDHSHGRMQHLTDAQCSNVRSASDDESGEPARLSAGGQLVLAPSWWKCVVARAGRLKVWPLLLAGAACCLCVPEVGAATFRWVPASNRIYVETGGSATLTDIKAALPTAPLDLVDSTNKIWLLRADLQVEDGCKLVLRGSAVGGDVNELRLQSVDSVTPCNCVVSITADWGAIDIHSTKITSWDTTAGAPDTNHMLNGRAFIRVRSSLSTNGITPLESRMDITNSEICHLGTDDSEAYGLVWKVTGSVTNSTNSIFDLVNVYGSVVKSHIHDNYFGIYTYGAQGLQCISNQVAYNAVYGIDPHDDSDYLVIEGNNVHHNGDDGIIASMRCDHLTIRGNTCWSNAQNGILLHRSSNQALVEGNRCYDNGDIGIALTASSQSIVRSNFVFRNGTAGIRLDLGSADNLIANNESASNLLYGFYFYKGGATPEPGDDGRPKRNQFTGNWVHHNGSDAIRLADSDSNTFATNTFAANGSKLRFQRGLTNWLDGNIIPADVSARTEGDAGSPASTFVRNQSYLDVELVTNGITVFKDALGRIYEPDEGAIFTLVSASGSEMVLTTAAIGSSSTVMARDFFVSATPGTANVNQLVWNPAARTQWSVMAGVAGQNLNFILRNLVANTNYLVSKADVAVTNLSTSASGVLAFADVASTTSAVEYSVEIANTNLATFQYSAALNRIYVKDGGTATLSDIKAALPSAPLTLLNATNRIWLLSAELQVQDGSKLFLHGTNAGGDVNELRLLSLNTGASNSVASITADWGTLDIEKTKITSWDTNANGPDTNPLAFGRAYIRVRSSLASNGITPLESRMDIAYSEVCYLGADASETYGLVWKVAGTSGPSNSLYSLVNVYGDVVNSHLHDNYIGAYTLGALNMQWLTNQISYNLQYGLDLQDESDGLQLLGNNLHHNGSHGLFVSTGCDALLIKQNLCWTNTKSGILLDVGSSNATVEANQCFNNVENGIALVGSRGNEIRENVLLRNQQAGLRLALGSAANTVEDNHCASNSLYGIHTLIGSGTPLPGDNGRPQQNYFVNNLLHGNGVEPLRVADSDDNTFAGNVFTDTSGKLRFQRGLRNTIQENTIPQTLSVRTEGETNAAASTYVRSQSYLKVELGTNGTTVVLDAAGRVYQPDEGTVATEVATNSTTLTLDTAGIGASSTVVVRSFWAGATPGAAYIHHLGWTNGTSRQWSVTPGAAGQQLSFTIADLLTNTTYVIRKDGVAVTNVQSDSAGQVILADTADSTATVAYSLVVAGANSTAPALPIQVNRTIGVSTALVVTNAATDAETPPYLLTYAFNSAPNNAVITSSGIIYWTPTASQGPSTNLFTTVVADNGVPVLNATNNFTVIVTNGISGPGMLLTIRRDSTNGVVVSWPSFPGGWTLEQSTNLLSPGWVEVNSGLISLFGNEFQAVITNLNGAAYYRLRQ